MQINPKNQWVKHEVWYKTSDQLEKLIDSKNLGTILQAEDITQRVTAETKLEKLEIISEDISDIAEIGFWDYNLAEDKMHWDSRTKVLHEVPDDYVPNFIDASNFYKLGHSRNTISMTLNKAIINEVPFREKLRLVTAKGNEIWVQTAGMPVFQNEKLIGLTGTFQNIDHRIRSEAKTKENEQLLQTLIDNLPLNVFIKDTESRKILVNKAECEYLGVTNADELIGKTDFDLFDKGIAQVSRDEDIKVMDTLTPMLGSETVSRKKNGEITTFLTSKIPLVDNNGRAAGLVGISMDISDLKQKEKKLRDLINIASQQNKKLINFAHIVSHNLRSHTANFSMLLDFLIDEKNEVEKQNILKMLTDASDNLLETLENLNEVVDINTNINIEKKSINLYSKISDVEQNLTEFLLDNNATIVNNISNKVEINIVASYIDNILMNFITNSVKYKDPERNPIVTLSTTSENGYTILSIKDNGLGIDLKKYGDKLFGMYKTFHNHTDAKGIGLFITKNQIEAMKGKVTVHSKVGVGTTFNVYFNEKN